MRQTRAAEHHDRAIDNMSHNVYFATLTYMKQMNRYTPTAGEYFVMLLNNACPRTHCTTRVDTP
jgi:prephenate dehydrogenase